MIKSFENFDIDEQSEENSRIEELLKTITELEEQNSLLVDKITDMNDTIDDLEDSLGKKENEIYELEDSIEKLERENKRLENENESWEKDGERWSDEKQELNEALNALSNPSEVFYKKESEEKKLMIIQSFIDTLNVMEDYPIEFGSLLLKEGTRYDRLLRFSLNPEWIKTYLGGGASILNRLDIKD